MAHATPEKVAVLVIRAWMEGHPPSLRARITRTRDVSLKRDVTSVASTRREIHSEVDSWIETLLEGGAADIDGGVTEA